VLNPDLQGKFIGKTVCIIDDYITNGYSAEAAKHILVHSGAKKVIFLSIGKFGTEYNRTEYRLTMNESNNYISEFLGEENFNRYAAEVVYNGNSDVEILNFADLID